MIIREWLMIEKINKFELKNKIQIAFTEYGIEHSQTLIFIHGLANYHGVWNWNLEFLQKYFHCIAIDLPGNGYSDRGVAHVSMDFYAQSIIDFILGKKLRNVSLVGHSMGGLVAMKVALSQPTYIQRLILSAPAGFEYYSPHETVLFKSAISFGNFLNLDETQVKQAIRSSFFTPNKIGEKIIEDLCNIIENNDRKQYRKMLEQSIDSMLNDTIFDQLEKIQQPALIFFGEEDMLIPNRFLHPVSTKEIAFIGATKIPHSDLRLYPHTGHFVHIEEAPKVNQEIVDFLC